MSTGPWTERLTEDDAIAPVTAAKARKAAEAAAEEASQS